MAEHRELLDRFAEARRTWDDLVALQPDVMAGSGTLGQDDLVELERRVDAHGLAVNALADALETGSDAPADGGVDAGRSGQARTGISNRESGGEHRRPRQPPPPLDTSSPPPEDAAGRRGERQPEDNRNRQTSHKAGSRSIAQKEAGSRYPDRSAPPSRKVAGAFGQEPADAPEGSRMPGSDSKDSD
jgi:hypothetical protein